jgi:hypothetical protein
VSLFAAASPARPKRAKTSSLQSSVASTSPKKPIDKKSQAILLEPESLSTPTPAPMVALIRPPSSTLFTDNRIGFEGQSYFSDLPEDHALSRSSFVTARLKGLYRSREGIQFRWDLMA